MIPNAVWGALPQHPGPHRVLLLLWQFSGWKPGSAEAPFSWPSPEFLAARLGVQLRAIRAALDKLGELGFLRPALEARIANGRREERVGWRLFEDPAEAAAYDRDRARRAQLDLFGDAPPAVDNSVDNGAGAHDPVRRCVDDPTQVRTIPCAGAQEICAGAHDTKERMSHELVSEIVVNSRARDHDDDVPLRLWRLYESERVRELGKIPGQPPDRGGLAPRELVDLFAALGGTAEAERALERYAIGSIALVVDAARHGRAAQAATLAQLRCDGAEWCRRRFDAVLARIDGTAALAELGRAGASASATPASGAPPPDPIVDGRRVDRFELEAFEQGGADAVREHRAAVEAAPVAGVAYLSDWLRDGRLPPEPTPATKAE